MYAIITGASKGMGYAISHVLADMGYNIIAIARNANDLEALKLEIKAIYNGVNVYPVSADLANHSQFNNAIEQINKLTQCPEVIINNAGMYNEFSIENDPDSNLELMLALNLIAPYKLSKAFIGEMKKRQSGHIVNISSIVTKHFRVNAAAYTVSKKAFQTFSKILTEEMRQYQVKVTTIVPGSTATASWEGTDDEILHELIHPEDVANAVRYAIEAANNTLVEEIIIKPLNPKY